MNSAPNRASIKAAITSKSDDDPDLERARQTARAEKIELDGREAFFKLRSTWSYVIIVWISIFIAFHIIITFLVGFHLIDFTSHKWLVPLVVTENFLQIVGMGYIVVRFFHPGHTGKATG